MFIRVFFASAACSRCMNRIKPAYCLDVDWIFWFQYFHSLFNDANCCWNYCLAVYFRFCERSAKRNRFYGKSGKKITLIFRLTHLKLVPMYETWIKYRFMFELAFYLFYSGFRSDNLTQIEVPIKKLDFVNIKNGMTLTMCACCSFK